MKNASPRLIAITTAIAIAILTALISILARQYVLAFFLFIGSGAVTFLSVYYALEYFIYRKIKLIYKTIISIKAPKRNGNTLVEKPVIVDSIDDVNKRVMQWAEDRKEEIEQLQKLEKYRREFVANVSHELKTPLFNIQGYIHTLLDGAIDDRTVSKNFLDKAGKNVERLVSLVADLEIISQLEAGAVNLETETFDIHALVNDVFESLEIKSKQKKITLSFKKGCDQPFYVIADKDKIRQVFVNLIDNSIKYGKEDGNTVISFYDMADNILTEVTDDGIGLAKEHLPRLFERFYRADKSRSRDQGGTGLGLSIVKHIIEAHTQTINVRSGEGVGTTFGFTLKKA
jgi:two-component system, OmpR family, phosphate regulon sensor histidine kinase PhoR